MPRSIKSKKSRQKRSNVNLPHPRPRTHAFTGCGNCRDRHVKCDLGTPSCDNCSRLKLTCEGYIRKYSWMPIKVIEPGQQVLSYPGDTEDVEDVQSSRRVLFSDEERAAMSLQMREECCSLQSSLDLDQVLRELQERIIEAGDFSRIGPFGILSMGKEMPVEKLDSTQSLESTRDGCENVEELPSIPTPSLGLPISPINWAGLEDFQGWESFATDSADVFAPSNCDPSRLDTCSDWDLAISTPQPYVNQIMEHNRLEAITQVQDKDSAALIELDSFIASSNTKSPNVHDLAMACELWTTPILIMSNDANLSKLPGDARLLLDHYSERIIDVMSMSPGQKAPWKTIHLPCAMEAFAEIIVHGQTRSVAKMALLYALLSVSSFHIGSAKDVCDDRATYWQEKGAEYKQISESYLRSALRDNMPKATRGKYKEVLMSVLSMVTIGVFSGNMQDAHTYLAESEALIRTQGLPKPVKSQKISKLHHIFSFLRIIHESTSLRAKESWQADPTTPLHERDAVQESGDLGSSRLDWVQEEESDDSEEDSLFVSIYQMPATLLSLLSQTSSLCKQLGSPESVMPAFTHRCQIIEDRIFKWKAPESLRLPIYHENSGPNSPTSIEASAQEVAAHLVNATYHALIVHFQRQIRNTNPRVLQHYVTIAADHLLVHEQLKQSRQISTAPFPWPGFIVACEAYDITPREKIDLYLKMIRSYNVGNLIKAEKVIYEVWRRHDLGRPDTHWDDVLKDWDMQIVLT